MRSLKSVLQKHHRRIKRRIARHKKAASWLSQKGTTVGDLRQKSAKLLTAGALASTLLLTPGTIDLPKLATGVIERVLTKPLSGESLKNALITSLSSILPKEPGSLSEEAELYLSAMFKKYLNITAVASLEGNHLNTTYGFSGQEQHLARFPGDTITNHNALQDVGMAPATGAWGYFVQSREVMTPEIINMEKYYVAVQTLYLPDWNTRQPYLKDWYKFRKVLIVNPKNGQAAVAVIGDAGPADWTGKQFGCSPELMHHLGLDIGMKKGEIIVFFVDDPGNNVKLGPIEYDKIAI